MWCAADFMRPSQAASGMAWLGLAWLGWSGFTQLDICWPWPSFAGLVLTKPGLVRSMTVLTDVGVGSHTRSAKSG